MKHSGWLVVCLSNWVRSDYRVIIQCSHTILSRPYSNMADTVHTTAQQGFKDGSFYDQNRPSYTDELVSQCVTSLCKETSEGVKYNILELGAGTGKFTRRIWPKLEKGCSYLATEPSEDFLKTLSEQTPGVETSVCTALDIPLPDNSVQNIICAQCFHWFANHDSLKEMTRVLVPRGRLILVWNNKDWKVDWVHGIEKILTEYYDDTPRAVTKQWKNVIESYDPLKCVEHANLAGISNMKGDKEFIIGHFSSISVISRLDDTVKDEVRGKFLAVLDKHFQDDEEINIPFLSEFYCVEKV